MKLTIGKKLFGFSVFFLIVVVAIGTFSYQKILEMDTITKKIKKLGRIDDILIVHYSNIIKLDTMIHNKKFVENQIETDHKNCVFGKWLLNRTPTVYPKFERLLNDIVVPHEKVHNSWIDIIKEIKNNDFIKAETLFQEMNRNDFQPLVKSYQPLVEESNLIISELQKENDMAIEQMRDILIVGLILLFLVAFLVGYYVKTKLVSPITCISKVAKSISVGDLSNKVDFQSDDELGELAQSFRQMGNYLGDFTKALHLIGTGDLSTKIKKASEEDILGIALENMTTNLKKLVVETADGIGVLTASVSQILATTSELSSSSAETSSAVAQTSSTAQEVNQTSQLNYDKAKHVVNSTQKAMSDSLVGQQSIIDNTNGLKKIKESMADIAKKVVELSEQSRTISQIVTSVEDIANQSNILSVNASIEAAKAGEQGKGFLVVASELKNLAEQSKDGTKKVQRILDDIQNVTNSLVMIAEHGDKSVDEGVEQAKKTQDVFDALKDTINEAANASKQIAASSEQGQAGMKQISDAMRNIQSSSNQNTTAIVQVESAVNSLNDLANKLKTISGKYKLGN